MNQHVLRIAGREYRAEVRELTPERALVVVDGKEYAVDLVRLGRWNATANASSPVTRSGAPAPAPAATAPAPGAAAPVGEPTGPVAAAPAAPPAAAPPAARQAPPSRGEGGVTAPMPGLVLKIRAKEGDTVQTGQVLLIMEAMKMENAITAAYNGTVSRIYVREGDSIGEGDLLIDVARPKMTAL